MSQKLLIVVCALALVLGLSFSAKAAVQNVKVGGDIEIKGVYQSAYDIYDEVSLLGITVFDNNPIVHDYLTQNVRLYVEAALTDNVEAYVRLIYTQDWGMVINQDDVEVDLAYITLNEIYGYPFSMTFGRQELLYGEGFLVGDGVRPGTIDSPTAYQYDTRKSFEAIKAVWNYDPHQIDLFVAKITEGSAVAPGFGAAAPAPVDTDNDLYGINWNYDGGVYGIWDLGLFYNRANAVNWGGEDRTLALSVRGEGNLPAVESGTLALKGEIVKEWGTVEVGTGGNPWPDNRLDAWGGYVEGEYTFDNPYALYFGLGYIYMSGDNLDTNKIEQFNPLFEDVKYGEIAEVVYGLYWMTGDTTMTNASIWKLSAGFNPTENTNIDLTYYSLRAAQEVVALDALLGFTGDPDNQNKYIGAEYDLKFTYNYSEDVTFGLMYALFVPGKFFEMGADDIAGLNVDLQNAQQLLGSVKVTF